MVSGQSSTIGGGDSNEASGLASTIGGGNINRASGVDSTVSGGYVNEASGSSSTVSGGSGNVATVRMRVLTRTIKQIKITTIIIICRIMFVLIKSKKHRSR